FLKKRRFSFNDFWECPKAWTSVGALAQNRSDRHRNTQRARARSPTPHDGSHKIICSGATYCWSLKMAKRSFHGFLLWRHTSLFCSSPLP
ncbi:hypothetical protein GOP47_0027633, partial [Adiantum capillus-veneris]